MAIANINIADFIKEGSNITFTVTDDGRIITISSSGGGGASISDTAYGVSWNGDTTNGASKNALYDKFESLSQNIDGGVSDSVYLVTQLADGGPA